MMVPLIRDVTYAKTLIPGEPRPKGLDLYETIPAGTEVRMIVEAHLPEMAGKREAAAVRACRDRLQNEDRRRRIVFALIDGSCFCLDYEDFYG